VARKLNCWLSVTTSSGPASGRRTPATTILARAHQEGRILVTLDKDFGELAVVRKQPHSGIVRLVGFGAREQAMACHRVLATGPCATNSDPVWPPTRIPFGRSAPIGISAPGPRPVALMLRRHLGAGVPEPPNGLYTLEELEPARGS
jgi:hypothetical protein